jgi:hypothetical protein
VFMLGGCTQCFLDVWINPKGKRSGLSGSHVLSSSSTCTANVLECTVMSGIIQKMLIPLIYKRDAVITQ